MSGAGGIIGWTERLLLSELINWNAFNKKKKNNKKTINVYVKWENNFCESGGGAAALFH